MLCYVCVYTYVYPATVCQCLDAQVVLAISPESWCKWSSTKSAVLQVPPAPSCCLARSLRWSQFFPEVCRQQPPPCRCSCHNMFLSESTVHDLTEICYAKSDLILLLAYKWYQFHHTPQHQLLYRVGVAPEKDAAIENFAWKPCCSPLTEVRTAYGKSLDLGESCWEHLSSQRIVQCQCQQVCWSWDETQRSESWVASVWNVAKLLWRRSVSNDWRRRFLGIFGWAASTQSSHAAFGAWFWKRFLCVTSARRYDAAHWHLQAEHLLAPSPESFCLPKFGWKNCCLASCGCVRQTKCFGSLRSTSFKRGFASHLRTSEGNNCGAHFGCALAVARGQPDPVEIRLLATAKLSSVLHSFQTWGWLLAGTGATCRRSLLRWGMVNSDKGDLWMTIKRHIDVGLTLEENSPLPVDSRGN